MGGQERTWVRPLRAGSLAPARVRRRAGGERRRAQAQRRPAWPPSVCVYERAPTASRTGPGAPAEGARAAPREGGRRGGGGKMRAQSPVRGGGTVEHPPSCLPLLTCVLGGVRTTPLPPRRGRAPSWPPPSRPLNSPGARGYCHRLASTTSSHATEVRAVGGEKETLVPASRRRRFRGLTKMAAAFSAATTTATATTTARYRYRRRGPSSREKQ